VAKPAVNPRNANESTIADAALLLHLAVGLKRKSKTTSAEADVVKSKKLANVSDGHNLKAW
jgi:hypothetical protein